MDSKRIAKTVFPPYLLCIATVINATFVPNLLTRPNVVGNYGFGPNFRCQQSAVKLLFLERTCKDGKKMQTCNTDKVAQGSKRVQFPQRSKCVQSISILVLRHINWEILTLTNHIHRAGIYHTSQYPLEENLLNSR